MRASVTRTLVLRELDESGYEADRLLELVDEICDLEGEDVEAYLWKAWSAAGSPISDPDDLLSAVEEQVAADLGMEADDLRETLRLTRRD
jgi:hypothetical protein